MIYKILFTLLSITVMTACSGHSSQHMEDTHKKVCASCSEGKICTKCAAKKTAECECPDCKDKGGCLGNSCSKCSGTK